jgi:hypothetical protein
MQLKAFRSQFRGKQAFKDLNHYQRAVIFKSDLSTLSMYGKQSIDRWGHRFVLLRVPKWSVSWGNSDKGQHVRDHNESRSGTLQNTMPGTRLRDRTMRTIPSSIKNFISLNSKNSKMSALSSR